MRGSNDTKDFPNRVTFQGYGLGEGWVFMRNKATNFSLWIETRPDSGEFVEVIRCRQGKSKEEKDFEESMREDRK